MSNVGDVVKFIILDHLINVLISSGWNSDCFATGSTPSMF